MMLDFISENFSNFVVVLENKGLVGKVDFLLSRRIVSFTESVRFIIFGYGPFGMVSQDSKLMGSELMSVLACDN